LSRPSIAELRAATQPSELLGRAGEEHWAGRLYMRRVSPYLTRTVVGSRVSANALTATMIVVGLAAALVVTLPGLAAAAGAAVLAQAQLLLDCSDGEVARWRRTSSAAGVYLDQIAHYSTEAALAAALGVRADGGFDSLGGWTAVGLAAAVLILFLKAETHLVGLARAKVGVGPLAADPASGRAASGDALVRGVRALLSFRPFHAVEVTLLALAAAVVDSVADDLGATRWLVAALAVFLAAAVVAHLAAVLRSGRLA
jgi:phosphatidylglycerophosphate synthase